MQTARGLESARILKKLLSIRGGVLSSYTQRQPSTKLITANHNKMNSAIIHGKNTKYIRLGGKYNPTRNSAKMRYAYTKQ